MSASAGTGINIINGNSGYCLSVPGASKGTAVGVNQYPCGGFVDQFWTLHYVPSGPFAGSYTITNDNSGLCLSVPGANFTQYVQLNQYPCGSPTPFIDQYWLIIYNFNVGKYEIINVNSSWCASVPGASKATAAIVNQYPCGDPNPYADQWWSLGLLTA